VDSNAVEYYAAIQVANQERDIKMMLLMY